MIGTDEQLLVRAQDGNPFARTALLARYELAVKAIAAEFFLPGGTRDDLRQEARIGLLSAIRDYRPGEGTTFKSFAGLCITRQVLTAVKTATRIKHRLLNDSARIGVSESGEAIEIVDLLPSDLCLDPYLIVVAKEQLADLIARMPKLTPLERRSILGLANGLTYSEVADLIGVTEKSVDNARVRAHLKLREAA